MSKFKPKKTPPIRLTDLLKKKKTNLKQFLSASGITTYFTLSQKCNKMGVSPPLETEFHEAVGIIVSSPQEGVVVLDPPTLLKDTGKKIQVDEPPTILAQTVSEVKLEIDNLKQDATVNENLISQKSSKKKKETVTEEL